MQDQRGMVDLQQGFSMVLILSMVLCTGCTSSPPVENVTPVPPISIVQTSPVPTFSTIPILTPDRMDQGSPVQVVGSSRFNIVQITLHNITVLSQGQKSGRASRLAVLDISLLHYGARAYVVDNQSLVCFESDHDQVHRLYPETSYFQETGEDPLLPCTLYPGQEKRGMVACQLLENVNSMVLYVRDRDWTIGGELVIPEISNGSQGSSDTEYPKNLEMIVHSAVRSSTLLGMGPLASGNKFAVINVSITNYGTADVSIQRENLFILTERDMALEHGGKRVTPEIARQFLRFPLVIPPGETKSGPILYYVYSSTRINRLVLTDRNFVINSIADLNGIYRYE